MKQLGGGGKTDHFLTNPIVEFRRTTYKGIYYIQYMDFSGTYTGYNDHSGTHKHYMDYIDCIGITCNRFI